MKVVRYVQSSCVALGDVRWCFCVPQIPAGETFETVLFAGNGIVDTILEWGGLLRQYHGKTDTLRMSDSSINYLG